MIIEGQITILASPQTVWDLLQDVPRVTRCLPGGESVTPVGADEWDATARSKVGPISVAFRGRLRLQEKQPPERIVFHFEGKDMKTASLVRVTVGVRLQPHGPDASSLAYNADVLLSGPLGQMGQGIVRETTTVMLDEFVKCVNHDLTQQPPAVPDRPSIQEQPATEPSAGSLAQPPSGPPTAGASRPFSTSLQLRVALLVLKSLLLWPVRRVRALVRG
ncbi:MAG: carbon monoxide dehydrogenase subunit G [Chloroflexi bacterium]|nr:carbon monoxide dehydrogenase subunit G [Chloroflexota bacterium]